MTERNGETPPAGESTIAIAAEDVSAGQTPRSTDIWPGDRVEKPTWTGVQKRIVAVGATLVAVFLAGWAAFARMDVIAAVRVKDYAVSIKSVDVDQDVRIQKLEDALRQLTDIVAADRADNKWLRESFYLHVTDRNGMIKPPPSP